MADVLTVQELRRAGDRHEYVLSRWPEKAELAQVVDALERHAEPLSDVASIDYDYSGSGDVIEVNGLTIGARPRIEAALFDALTAAADDPAAEADIRTSLDALPLDVP